MQGKALSERSAGPEVYVGIDVSKDRLDVSLHPTAESWDVANDRAGLRTLKRRLAGHKVRLVVMEATGKYHRQAHRTLHAAGLAVAVVNPLRTRLFAEATGTLAKTDRIDARILALAAESLAPAATTPAPEAREQLQELVRARSAATAETTALANRRRTSTLGFLKTELARHITSLRGHIDRLEAEIERRIADDPGLARRYAILLSIPSIGPAVAWTLLVELAELGACSAKAVAALAGLAPVARDSGQSRGERHIRGGRPQLRASLYMAAVTAIRCNADAATFYGRLREAGKPAKLALTGVMRKLVVLANTLIAEDRVWKPQRP